MSSLQRYSRQIVLPEIGVNGQGLLRDSSVVLFGLGGLGSAVAPYLVAAGVGRLRVVDHDRVDLSNLQRQILYVQADVGRAKAEAAAERLRALNAEAELEACVQRADAETLPRLIRDADVVVDGTDNFPTRFLINAACVALRKPLVAAAAIRFEGQAGVFDSSRGGPCYACLFDEAGETQERCEEAGVLGPVVGNVGSLQALLCLRLLLGLGSADRGRLHLWDAMALHWRSVQVARDPHCRICGSSSS